MHTFPLQLEYATGGGVFYQGRKEIHVRDPRRDPRRATKNDKGPLRGWWTFGRAVPRIGRAAA